MVIQIAPKEKIRISIFAIIGGIVCFFLAAFLASAYFYFDLNISKMNEGISQKQAQLGPIEKTIQEKEQELVPIKEKIDSFSVLVGQHQTSLDVYGFLEKNSLPKVWFSDFEFSLEEKMVTVSGQADSFITLEQQMNVLKNNQADFLESVKLSKVEVDEEGGINFEMEFIFKTQLLKPSLIKEETPEENVD
jgi:hypothetical protein